MLLQILTCLNHQQPANIFLSNGVVKIGDFGLAKRKFTEVEEQEEQHHIKLIELGSKKRVRHRGTRYECGKQNIKRLIYGKECDILHNSHTVGCGTISYCAPEQTNPGGIYSEKVVRNVRQEKILIIKKNISQTVVFVCRIFIR